MTNSERLIKQLVELYSLVHIQQSLRLALRSFWLGMTGILVGWGVNALWGWLPNPLTWILIGLAFALVPILMIWGALYPVLFALNPNPGWVWRMDRTLGLREQFSTAWEVAQQKQTGRIDVPILLVSAGCGYVAAAQRRLSTPVRRLRRSSTGIDGEIAYADGTRERIDAAAMTSAPSSRSTVQAAQLQHSFSTAMSACSSSATAGWSVKVMRRPSWVWLRAIPKCSPRSSQRSRCDFRSVSFSVHATSSESS